MIFLWIIIVLGIDKMKFLVQERNLIAAREQRGPESKEFVSDC